MNSHREPAAWRSSLTRLLRQITRNDIKIYMANTVQHQDLKSYFGDEDHLELSQQFSFAELIYRTLSEQVPTKEQLKVFELILNMSIDHGPDTPSAIKTIEAAKSGATISESVAAGVLQINDQHGGAIEPCMKILYEMEQDNVSAHDVVAKFIAAEMRLPGFGHRLYKEVDPRAQLILSKVGSDGEECVQMVKDLEQALKDQTGKQLPVNIDGAIAAALCSFGWDPKLGKAVFLVARMPGLCAHYLDNS